MNWYYLNVPQPLKLATTVLCCVVMALSWASTIYVIRL